VSVRLVVDQFSTKCDVIATNSDERPSPAADNIANGSTSPEELARVTREQ